MWGDVGGCGEMWGDMLRVSYRGVEEVVESWDGDEEGQRVVHVETLPSSKHMRAAGHVSPREVCGQSMDRDHTR